MTALESRYRRLLAIYPPQHRALYGEEMVGVLMEGTRPGQRFPALADVVDVLRAGVRTRFSGDGKAARGTGWRNAAAAAGFVMTLILAGAALPTFDLGLVLWGGNQFPGDVFRLGGLVLGPGLRSGFWAATAVALVIGARRSAIWLAAAGVLVEASVFGWWWQRGVLWVAYSWAWAPVLGLMAFAAVFVAAKGRPVRAALDRRGLGFVGAAAAVTFIRLVLPWGPVVLHEQNSSSPWLAAYTDFVSLHDRGGDIACLALLAAAVLSAAPGVRGRVIVLLLPAFVGLSVLQGWYDGDDFGHSARKLAVAGVVTVVVAGLVFATKGFVGRGART